MQAGDLLHQLVDIGYSDCLVGRYGGSICIAAAWDSFICILCQSVCLSIYGSLHNAARKWNVHPWFFLSWLVLAVLWPAVLLHFRRISLSGLQGYHRHRLRPSPLRLLPSFPSSLHRNPQSHLILHLVSSRLLSIRLRFNPSWPANPLYSVSPYLPKLIRNRPIHHLIPGWTWSVGSPRCEIPPIGLCKGNRSANSCHSFQLAQ